MVKTQVSSKGQTTIPVELRNRWRTSQVIWSSNPDGSASVRPAPDVMTLLGKAGATPPRSPDERELAAGEIARVADKRGRAR
jgi:bifunctional DNA-binding transcriptional regulator/antitoxin component of YhaV-PrlF toxin-antitoxin module